MKPMTIKQQLHDAKQQLNKVNLERSQQNRIIGSLQDEVKTLMTTLSTQTTQVRNLHADCDGMTARLEEWDAYVRVLMDQRDRVNKELAEAKAQTEQMTQTLAEVKKQLADAEYERRMKAADNTNLYNRICAYKDMLAEANENRAAERAYIKQLEEKLGYERS